VVVHYVIRQSSLLADFAIDGDHRRFLTLSELVNYYRRNSAGALATRLRRPPTRDTPMWSAVFPSDIQQLDLSRLRFSTNIISAGGVSGECGVVWNGVYDGRPVAVKVHVVNVGLPFRKAATVKDRVRNRVGDSVLELAF